MNTIKENIVRILKEQGRTQTQLYRQMGISSQALQYYFRANLSLSNLQKIADALGVDPYLLIKPYDPQDNHQPKPRTEPTQAKAICPHCGKTLNITIQ